MDRETVEHLTLNASLDRIPSLRFRCISGYRKFIWLSNDSDRPFYFAELDSAFRVGAFKFTVVSGKDIATEASAGRWT